jgi:hypothetical protein
VKPATAAPTNSGRRRRLQDDNIHELRIVEIHLQNSNLTGELPVDVFAHSFPRLRLLDLNNTGSEDENVIIYGDGCLPLQSCLNKTVQCILPETLPPLCGPASAPAQKMAFPLAAFTAIVVTVLALIILFLCCYLIAVHRRAQNKGKKPKPRKRKRSKKDVPHDTSRASMTSMGRKSTTSMGRRSTTSMGERRVSFLGNPALVYKPDPVAPDGARKRRRNSSLSAKQRKQWRPQHDPASGRQFWVNDRTGEFSWIGPDEEPEDERIIPPPTYPYEDDHLVQVPLAVGPDTQASGSRRRSRQSDYATEWEMVYDDATQTRYMVNSRTNEFVVLADDEDPRERFGGAFSTGAAGHQDDVEPDAHDPLWKAEYDHETNEWYWIDVETGQVSFEQPVTGTIVSAEMLEATGRYSEGQVYMIKPEYVKRPSGTSTVASDINKERRKSSGLHTFQPPRRSSGLEALDLGHRRPSGGSHDHGKGPGVFGRASRTSTNSAVNEETYTMAARAREDDDDDEDEDEDDEQDRQEGSADAYYEDEEDDDGNVEVELDGDASQQEDEPDEEGDEQEDDNPDEDGNVEIELENAESDEEQPSLHRSQYRG